jgi:hypothetical protein
MRATILLVGVALLTCSQPLTAQSLPYYSANLVADAEVRSGPTERYYATSRLPAGTQVAVLHESKEFPGWVAIKPPADSFSMIDAAVLKVVDRIGYVDIDLRKEAHVWVGSQFSSEPSVESARIRAGHQVVVLGQPRKTNMGMFYPIAPLPGEKRWIPVESLRGGLPGGNQLVSLQGLQRYPLLMEAEQALQYGDTVVAYRKFNEALVYYTEPAVTSYIQRRMQSLGGAGYPPNTQWPGQWQPAPSYPQPQPTYPQGSYDTGFGAPPTPAAPAANAQWIPFWGILKKTTFAREGRPIYVLENQTERKMEYVMAAPEKSLETLVGRTVALYGIYQTDPNGQRIMIVYQSSLPPEH